MVTIGLKKHILRCPRGTPRIVLRYGSEITLEVAELLMVTATANSRECESTLAKK